jgi:integrase
VGEIKRAFHTAVRKAGIEDFHFHDFRHCAATNLRRAGVDTVTAMKIIGHKSEKMYRRYNSVSEADLTKAASKINTYLTPASESLPPKSASA